MTPDSPRVLLEWKCTQASLGHKNGVAHFSRSAGMAVLAELFSIRGSELFSSWLAAPIPRVTRHASRPVTLANFHKAATMDVFAIASSDLDTELVTEEIALSGARLPQTGYDRSGSSRTPRTTSELRCSALEAHIFVPVADIISLVVEVVAEYR